jgi:hypothetical protein
MSPSARPDAPDRLWVPVVAPLIWSTHFTISYIWAAMACGRFAAQAAGSLEPALIVMTVLALVAIGILFLRAFRQLNYQLPDRPNDDGTAEDRNRFMSYTTMLLAGMSWIGTLFVGVSATAVGGCQ